MEFLSLLLARLRAEMFGATFSYEHPKKATHLPSLQDGIPATQNHAASVRPGVRIHQHPGKHDDYWHSPDGKPDRVCAGVGGYE